MPWNKKFPRAVGSGTFGHVFQIDSDSVVKVMIDHGEPDQHESFLKEIECMKRMTKHTNVVDVKEYGVGWCSDIDIQAKNYFSDLKNTFGFIKMEYVWFNLHGWMSDKRLQRTIGWKKKIKMFAGLASGLKAMHNAGIAHRDIKPGNVLVGCGVMKFCDFGMAQLDGKSIGKKRKHSVEEYAVVTSWYRAPEVELFIDSGKAMDIWSFGCIMFEILQCLGAQKINELFRVPKMGSVPGYMFGAESDDLRSDIVRDRVSLVEAAKIIGAESDGLIMAMVQLGVFEMRARDIREWANGTKQVPLKSIAEVYEAATAAARGTMVKNYQGCGIMSRPRALHEQLESKLNHHYAGSLVDIVCAALEPIPRLRISAGDIEKKILSQIKQP